MAATSSILYLSCTTVLLLVVVWLFNKLRGYYTFMKKIRAIPNPRPAHWLMGHLNEVTSLRESVFMKLLDISYKQKNKIGIFWFGAFWPSVSVIHPDGFANILKTPKSEPLYQILEPWLGQGLLIANGKRWYRSRRLITPAFHFDILKPYVYIYNEAANVLLDKWEKAMQRNESVLVHDAMSKLSLDIILQCAFSLKSNCQEKIVDVYASSVKELCDLMGDRFVILPPLLLINDFLFYYFTPQGWRYRKALRVVHSRAEEVIRKRRAELGQDLPPSARRRTSSSTSTDDDIKMAKAARKNMDFLDALLTAKDEDGLGLNDLEIRCEVDTFMFEGHDTTANGLTWCLYMLAKYPEHQQKCREEVQNVLRGRNTFEYEDIVELKYIQWCIKESLRIYPPVYEFYRRMPEDTEICGYTVPQGAQVAISVFGIHRNPNVWENPMVFDPLRFHPDNSANRSPYAYIPFSAGSRNCIGQNFAMNEMCIVLGLVLNRFSLHLDENHKVEAAPIVLLRAADDVKLYLKPLSA